MAQPPLIPQPSDLGSSNYLECLGTQGWVHVSDFLPTELTERLRQEALQRDSWITAGIGASGEANLNIRRDRTIWFDGATAAQTQYMALMESIRLQVNEHFFAGLFEYEAHFAHYPTGAFYRKHRDALRGSNARVLTSVCYLNQHWLAGDGGELVIYNDDDNHIEIQITPQGGDLVLFWSEDFPHEVLPAARDRYSISGWFRRNIESANPL